MWLLSLSRSASQDNPLDCRISNYTYIFLSPDSGEHRHDKRQYGAVVLLSEGNKTQHQRASERFPTDEITPWAHFGRDTIRSRKLLCHALLYSEHVSPAPFWAYYPVNVEKESNSRVEVLRCNS
jgi:hypothetical protein